MSQYLKPAQIERNTPQPVYQQIYEQLKRELVLGNYQTGERFFSYRKLKDIYKTELRTIGSAVELLIRDGLLEKRATSGIYVIKQENISEVGNVWYAVMDEQCYHPFFFNILIGLVKEAEKFGLRIIVRFGRDHNEFMRWFAPKPGEGLIITGDLDKSILKAAGQKCNDNMIIVGNYDINGNFGHVTTDCYGKIFESLQIAGQHGCKRFALISGAAKTKIATDIREIMEDFCKNADCDWIAVEELAENGYKGMSMLKDFKPDCVLMTEPAFAGVWEYMLENSLKCPDDIFLIRYGKEKNDNSLLGRAAIELESNSETHGRTALQMLLKNSKNINKVKMQLIQNISK